MKEKLSHWFLFAVLCLIWGSSFMLMKEGMRVLTAYQVATIRMLSAGLVLLPFTFRAYKKIPSGKIVPVILSGLFGNFFPAYLFCLAEVRIDSALAGILNALTPLFTVLVGIAFFELRPGSRKLAGVLIGFAGLCLLFTMNGRIDLRNASYALLILLATFFYGVNVNLVGRYLQGISPLHIASFAFGCLVIPCLVILFFTGFFSLPLQNTAVMRSTGAACILGTMGTAAATVLFYMLLKRAGSLFASMVTYGIPFVAVAWGIFLGEKVQAIQGVSLAIILAGVWMTDKRKK